MSKNKVTAVLLAVVLLVSTTFQGFGYSKAQAETPDNSAASSDSTANHIPFKKNHTTKYTAKNGSFSVEVWTAPDAFTVPVELKIDEVSDKKTAALKANDKSLAEDPSLSVDIRFVTKDGTEIEPKGGASVRLSVSGERVREERVAPESLEVVHLVESTSDKNKDKEKLTPETVATPTEKKDGAKIAAVKDDKTVPINEALDISVDEDAVPAPESATNTFNLKVTDDKSAPADKPAGVAEDVDEIVAEFYVDSFSQFFFKWTGYGSKYVNHPLWLTFNCIEEKVDRENNQSTQPINLQKYGLEGKTFEYRTYRDGEVINLEANNFGEMGNANTPFYPYINRIYDYTYTHTLYIDKKNKDTIYEVKTITPRIATGYINYFDATGINLRTGKSENFVIQNNGYDFSDTLFVNFTSKRHPGVVETVDTSNKLKMSVFKYNTAIINDGHTFKFTSGGDLPGTINDYVGETQPNSGIVANKLGPDGFPVLAQNGESLSYLFGPEDPATGIQKRIDNLNHLLIRQPDGSVGYDSDKNFATLSTDPNLSPIPHLGNEFTVYDRASNSGKNFLPFNDMNDSGYINGNPQYHFGVVAEATITQPKNGQVAGKDMVFDFNGDDDLWVFVDDVLMLDLGGIHGKINGSINFATGEIKTPAGTTTIQKRLAEAGNPKDITLKNGKYEDYTNHVVKVFYFERGENLSNLKLYLNLNVVPRQNLYLGKDLSGNLLPTDPKVPYNFLVEFKQKVGDGYADSYVPYSGPYAVYKGDIAFPERATQIRTGTMTNGRVQIGDGEFIRISSDNISSEQDKFRITEYVDEPERVYTGLYDIFTNVSTVETTDVDNGDSTTRKGYTIGDVPVNEAPVVQYTNRVNVENLGSLVIEKQMSGRDEQDTFSMITTLDGSPYEGEYKVYPADATTYSDDNVIATRTAKNGVIELSASQKAVISGILWNTPYTVREDTTGFEAKKLKPPEYALTVTDSYDKNSGVKRDLTATDLSDGAVKGKIPLSKKSSVQVTVTNKREKVEVPITGVEDSSRYGVAILVCIGLATLPMLLKRTQLSRKK